MTSLDDWLTSWITPEGRILTVSPPDIEEFIDFVRQGYRPTDNRWFLYQEYQLKDDYPGQRSSTRLQASNCVALINQGVLSYFKPKGSWRATSLSYSSSARVYVQYLGFEVRPELLNYVDIQDHDF